MKRYQLLLAVLLPLFVFASCGGNKNTEKTVAQQKDRMSQKRQYNKTIVFFGNSIASTSEVSFPDLIQSKIDGLALPYKCINAGLEKESTTEGNERIEWILENYEPDVFVLALGGDDGLQGILPEKSKQNLQEMINKIRVLYPQTQVVLVGSKAPSTMDEEYIVAFRDIYPELALDNSVQLVNVFDDENEKDRDEQEDLKILARGVWTVLQDLVLVAS